MRDWQSQLTVSQAKAQEAESHLKQVQTKLEEMTRNQIKLEAQVAERDEQLVHLHGVQVWYTPSNHLRSWKHLYSCDYRVVGFLHLKIYLPRSHI